MRKFTLFIASLFLTIGAMAQAELDKHHVTFTNVQNNGKQFSLYVNSDKQLVISRDPASTVGETALFLCTKHENGKYSFYNEAQGVYMIWRNNSDGGADGGDGTMATYNSTYCDWTLNASTNCQGGYYIVSKRANGNDGSLVFLQTDSENVRYDGWGNSEAWSDTYSNVFLIDIVETGDKIIEITYEYSYNGEVRGELTQTMNAKVGDEFPAVSSMPYGITAVKPEGNVEESDANQTFTIELQDNLPFVAAESYEKITHWYYMTIHATSPKYLYHEAGQTNIPLTVATKPAADAKYAWAFVGNPFDGYAIYNYAAGADMVLSSSTTMSGNTGAGTYPVMTDTPVPSGNNTLWVPTASSHGTNGFFLAQKGAPNKRMNNRDSKLAYWTGGADAGSTFMVSRCIVPNGYYRIAYNYGNTNYYLQGVASSIKGCAFTATNDAESIWYYANSKLLSYTAGKYIKEDGNTRGLQGYGVEGGNVTIEVSSRNANKYNVKCASYLHFVDNGVYYGDHCGSDGGHATHDMILENVMSLPVTIGVAGWATFYAPVAVKVAEGVKAYAVKINGSWATLNEIEGGIIPANTGVVLQGEANTYDFVVTATTATVDSDLRGSAAAAYIAEDAYVLTADDTCKEGVCFGKAKKNQQGNASWLNNSHKAYLLKPAGMNVAAYSFRFGGNTTAVEEVETENAEAVIYDLSGRCINEITEAGIYIVNGKKVLVK